MPRYYFAIPFEDREVVRALGARWDKECKSWYAPTERIAQLLKLHGYPESLDICDKLFVPGFSDFYEQQQQQNSNSSKKKASKITNFFVSEKI